LPELDPKVAPTSREADDLAATPPSNALRHIRICDLTGQLAGAGSTRFLAAFGAQIIRIEDPTNQGRWDILRGTPPLLEGMEGTNAGGAFNNHNVEKLGVTINLRDSRGRDILRRLIKISDAVTENFSSGVMERIGFGYDELRRIKPDIVYVSNNGFGKTGPYVTFKTWGPIVQACSGLTFSSGLPDQPPAGWGYSYMDHMGANTMAVGLLAGLVHRSRTGEGQWIDMASTEAGLTLAGPELLDFTVNGRPLRRPGSPNSNRVNYPVMVPHGVFPASGEDSWVAIACRDDGDWERLAGVIGEEWAQAEPLKSVAGRLAAVDDLEGRMAAWTSRYTRREVQDMVQGAGVPGAMVATPEDRIEHDSNTRDWGLWPTVRHAGGGTVRVDGLPIHLSETDWVITRGGPALGQHNGYVFGEVLGIDKEEQAALARDGVI
jgi:crotonobetainyl-CoA:carnitine CoA-transferase CaiB-like acyl-CoA transferase